MQVVPQIVRLKTRLVEVCHGARSKFRRLEYILEPPGRIWRPAHAQGGEFCRDRHRQHPNRFDRVSDAYAVFELPLVPANLLAWLVAVSGSYVMNCFITFAAESGRQLRWRAYGAFVLSGIAGVVANTTTLVIASYWIPVLLAKLLAIGASFAVNFSLSHFVVFRTSQPRIETSAE